MNMAGIVHFCAAPVGFIDMMSKLSLSLICSLAVLKMYLARILGTHL